MFLIFDTLISISLSLRCFKYKKMQIEGAIVKEQGQTFAIVVVKQHVLNSNERDQAQNAYSDYFPGMPIVLMAQNSQGRPTYYGRHDIVNFLSKIHISRIPWEKYTFN